MEPFKVCPKCKFEWKTRDEFLSDRSIYIIGFMADLKDFDKGAYLFNHVLSNNKCSSTLALRVPCFLDLYDGPVFEELKAGSDECSGYCARIDVLERCRVNCRNAVAREIIQKISSILSSNRNRGWWGQAYHCPMLLNRRIDALCFIDNRIIFDNKFIH